MLHYNAELFAGIPQLRATFFLKVFSRRVETRRFVALALLFRRAAGGVICADAVSCGTEQLHRSANLPPAIGGILRDLGVPPALDRVNPWPAVLNPFITVPGEDLHFWRNDPATGAPVLIPQAPAVPADLQICLWSIIWKINLNDPFS